LLTGFSTQPFGSAKRKTQDIVARKRRSLIEGTLELQQQFIGEVDPGLLERHCQTRRNPHYSDYLTFWAFFSQVAIDDASCAGAVARVQAWAEQRGLPVAGQSTCSYCEARASLPVEMLRAVNDSLYRQLDAHLPGNAHWHEVPNELQVRLIRCKGPDREGKQKTRYIVTTLLDPKAYPADEVASLYLHRWEIEVRFRDIKTTLGMEMPPTKSPRDDRKGAADAPDRLQPDAPRHAQSGNRIWIQSPPPQLSGRPTGHPGIRRELPGVGMPPVVAPAAARENVSSHRRKNRHRKTRA